MRTLPPSSCRRCIAMGKLSSSRGRLGIVACTVLADARPRRTAVGNVSFSSRSLLTSIPTLSAASRAQSSSVQKLLAAARRLLSSVRRRLRAGRLLRTAGRRLSGVFCSRRVALMAPKATCSPYSIAIPKLMTGFCHHTIAIRKLEAATRTLQTPIGKVMAAPRSESSAQGTSHNPLTCSSGHVCARRMSGGRQRAARHHVGVRPSASPTR
jgi:hypothetical protein